MQMMPSTLTGALQLQILGKFRTRLHDSIVPECNNQRICTCNASSEFMCVCVFISICATYILEYQLSVLLLVPTSCATLSQMLLLSTTR